MARYSDVEQQLLARIADDRLQSSLDNMQGAMEDI